MHLHARPHRRTLRSGAFWLGAALLACVLGRDALAQPAAVDAVDARTVAARVQSFYDQTRDVSADFYQTYVNQLYKRTDRSQGKVVFKKPGMMRWDYAQPNGKIIVSDGRRLLMYEPGEDGDKGQYAEQLVNESQLPQAMAFLTGTGRLEESFTFRLLDATKEGFANGDVLELQPKVPTPHYARILFYVERDPRLRGLVRRILIIDESGNRNRFDFSAIKFNGSVTDELFRWAPPAGSRKLALK